MTMRRIGLLAISLAAFWCCVDVAFAVRPGRRVPRVWQEQPGSDAGKTLLPAGTATTFSAARIEQLRDQARQGPGLPSDMPDGWFKSDFDPAKILAVFPSLHLKKGFRLRAYQLKVGRVGEGVVWAMPERAGFPEPKDCPKTKENPSRPKPAAALDHVMDAIEGDGSPESYLCASLFSRQLWNFGATQHTADWTTHKVLDANPLKAGKKESGDGARSPTGSSDSWKWIQPEPKEWRPSVRVEKDRVTVVFYTFCGFARQTIYRLTDTYKPESYRFQTEEKEIAVGLSGFITLR